MPDTIISGENGDKGLLYDSSGNQIIGLIRANLSTGEVVKYKIDSTKNIVKIGNYPLIENLFYDLPLTFEPVS